MPSQRTEKCKEKTPPRKKISRERKTHYNGVALPSGTDPESRHLRRRMRNKLSAQVHRQRKQDTLNSVKQEVEDRNVVIQKLKGQLDEMKEKSSSLQRVIESIEENFGPEVLKSILEQSSEGTEISTILQFNTVSRSVSSESSGPASELDTADDEDSFSSCRR